MRRQLKIRAKGGKRSESEGRTGLIPNSGSAALLQYLQLPFLSFPLFVLCLGPSSPSSQLSGNQSPVHEGRFSQSVFEARNLLRHHTTFNQQKEAGGISDNFKISQKGNNTFSSRL